MKVMMNGINILILISFLTINQLGAKDLKDGDEIGIEYKIADVEGLFYTVQIGVFSKQLFVSDFPETTCPLYFEERKDGLYTYFTGLFDCRFEALMMRYEMVNSGIYDAFVIVYYNGEAISMSEADLLLKENGESILYNSKENQFLNEIVEN